MALPSTLSTLDTTPSDGTEFTSTGYYAIRDGNHLTYIYSASSTLPPDGVDQDHPGTVYRPTSISDTDPGRWIAQLDRTVIQAGWFGAKADNSQDDTPYIQAAIDRAINISATYPWSCYTVALPNGNIKTTDTIHLGYGTNSYSFISLVSNNRRGGYFTWGCKLKPTFTDRPVINIQGGRHVSIEGIGIIGTYATTSLNSNLPANESAWDAVVSTGGKNQFAGISVDAYSGTEPVSGGYANAPAGWSKYHSSDVKIKECYISQVGCGVIIKPSGGDGNGDYVELQDCHIQDCKYGFSVNGSQARGNRATNSKFINCYAAAGVGWFGPNLGRDVFLESCAIEGCTWMIKGQNTDWVGKYVIEKCFGERCCGIIDLANGGSNCNVTIRDNSFAMFNGDDSSMEVRQHVSAIACGMTFTGNRFVNEGTTRPSIIVRYGIQSEISNNVMVRTGASYSAPKLVAIPANSGASKLSSERNSNTLSGDLTPTPAEGVSGVIMASATYTGSKRYSGQSASILGNLPSGLSVAANDIIACTRSGDSVTMLFKVITPPASQFATVVLEQINDCDGTNPMSSSDTITRLATSGSTYILRGREPMLSGPIR